MPGQKPHSDAFHERNTPAQTEVPAGPGDAGASDKPKRLKRHAEARLRDTDRMLIRALWGAALVILLILLAMFL